MIVWIECAVRCALNASGSSGANVRGKPGGHDASANGHGRPGGNGGDDANGGGGDAPAAAGCLLSLRLQEWRTAVRWALRRPG